MNIVNFLHDVFHSVKAGYGMDTGISNLFCKK